MEEFIGKQRDQAQASFVHYTSAEAALRHDDGRTIFRGGVFAVD
jgi:hypothetical protein